MYQVVSFGSQEILAPASTLIWELFLNSQDAPTACAANPDGLPGTHASNTMLRGRNVAIGAVKKSPFVAIAIAIVLVSPPPTDNYAWKPPDRWRTKDRQPHDGPFCTTADVPAAGLWKHGHLASSGDSVDPTPRYRTLRNPMV